MSVVTTEQFEVPPAAVPARRTPSFTAESMPPALGRSHLTSVWAELVVEEGSVQFTDEASRNVNVTAGQRTAIPPDIHHHIEPAQDAVFHIQFYR